MSSIITWAMTFLLAQSPTSNHKEETPDEVMVRYKSIAQDLAAVVYDPQESPVYTGSRGRVQTLALMASISLYESGFRKDVDLGVGPKSRGDGGRSVCLMQVQVGSGRTPEYNQTRGRFAIPGDPTEEVTPGYTANDLLSDRKNCFRAALHYIRQSFIACSALPVEHRLAVYASGSCDGGLAQSRQRVLTGQNWYSAHFPDFTDDNAQIDQVQE